MAKYVREGSIGINSTRIVDVSKYYRDDKGHPNTGYYTYDKNYNPNFDLDIPNRYYIYDADIYKESDNLDDLVDVYVAVLRKNKYYEKDEYRVIGTRYLAGIKKDYVDKGYSVYGAIWNTLGLEFVTYMDKNGKLKLL